MTTPSQGAFDSSVIDELLSDQVIAFKSIFRDITGRTPAALLLSQLHYWTRVIDRKNSDRRGWIHKSTQELMDETGLSDEEIKNAKRRLKSLNLLEMTVKGSPTVTWMRIHKPTLYRLLKEAISRREKAEKERKEQEKRDRKNGRIKCPVQTEDVPDWILRTEDFRAPKPGGKTGQNRPVGHGLRQRGSLALSGNGDLPSPGKVNDPPLLTENTNRKEGVVNAEMAETDDFDFDQAFAVVLGLLNKQLDTESLPEALLEAIWLDYKTGATSPSYGRAVSFMVTGIQQHMATQRRSMAVSHSRDELATARIRQISAQKTLADRKTREFEPGDRMSREWAEGLEILEGAE